jgi:hypothetical protein
MAFRIQTALTEEEMYHVLATGTWQNLVQVARQNGINLKMLNSPGPGSSTNWESVMQMVLDRIYNRRPW